MTPIAITGIDCRLPGADGPDALWEMLVRGRDAIGPVPASRWAGGPPAGVPSRGGFVDDLDAFDHAFFGIAPAEAAAMDPQQRMAAQCAWRALEDGGVRPPDLAGGRTGVFLGVMGGEWTWRLADPRAVTPALGTGAGHGMIAGRLSYLLDLRGPSMAVDTACSSSLVAVHLACTSLALGECDLAIAGGVNAILTPALHVFYARAGLAAPDGRCKPFSAGADGIGRGEGVAMVVLRRLDDALAAGAPVYAVIRGGAVGQDGRSNGLTAPSRGAQREVIAAACDRAGVRPADVGVVEAHGTGTVLGDMIEASALGDLRAGSRDRPCLIGSVKGNIGHCEGAAGAAGLVKLALSLHHRLLPPSPHARTENGALRLASRGLRLAKAPVRLGPDALVGGVSAFGLGGTNAHLVLEAAPRRERPRPRPRPGGQGTPGRGGVFTLSADGPEGLRRNLAAQHRRLARYEDGDPAALCRASNRVKTGLAHRFAAPVTDHRELLAVLASAADGTGPLTGAASFGAPGGAGRAEPAIGLVLPGQGAQYPGMTAALYRTSARYRAHLDAADEALRPHVGLSVRDLILDGDGRIHRTAYAQPGLFAVEYALGRTLMDLGPEPAFLLGHSVGEFAAACLAGALSLPGAARLVGARGRIMEELPRDGAMLGLRWSRSRAAAFLDGFDGAEGPRGSGAAGVSRASGGEAAVCVAAVNGPRDVVLAGERRVLDRLRAMLPARDVLPLDTVAHAFHSPLMRPAAERFAEVARTVGHAPPAIPVFSTVLGGPLGEVPLDAGYWTGQITAPVLFGPAIATALATGPTHVVEAGPRPTLTTLIRRMGRDRAPVLLNACAGPGGTAGGTAGGIVCDDLLEVAAALYRAGADPDWDVLHPDDPPPPYRLAPYEFSTEHRFSTQVGTVLDRPRERPDPPPESGPAPAPAPIRAAEAACADDPHAAAVRAALAAVCGHSPDRIAAAASLHADLGLDSVMFQQLARELEERLPGRPAVPVRALLAGGDTVAGLTAHLRTRPATMREAT
ncbi:type I polyketide synthase [Actinomadura viridis]|uniref:Acyl transferase domain-containing protein n=1 Tax=Actinomadura viridis TaxID=58110 RepID=A0A931DAZ5_9ACTN|nr:type I polyketide synthase [Actinomadura viridis]MBG6086845.1 acyl transferase domain-containing protein [Actinomadura viridis]